MQSIDLGLREYQKVLDDASKQIREQKQKEIQNREYLIELTENQNQLTKNQNEILQLQVDFLKNIDGNTQQIVEKFNQLIPSQYATEAIQSEMLEIIKNVNSNGNYWEGVKSQFQSIARDKGFEYLIAFIITAIKYSVGMGIE